MNINEVKRIVLFFILFFVCVKGNIMEMPFAMGNWRLISKSITIFFLRILWFAWRKHVSICKNGIGFQNETIAQTDAMSVLIIQYETEHVNYDV